MQPEENTVAIHDAREKRWFFFEHPVAVYVARTLDEVVPALKEVERQVRQDGLMAAGFVAYEAAPAFDPALTVKSGGQFPLLWFGLYRSCRDMSVGEIASPGPMQWNPSVSEDEYRHAIGRIKEYIRAGDTYQVNYTLRLRTRFREEPWPFFARLIRAQRCEYGAFVNTADWTVCCASPELFFRLEGRELVSRPMKGTIGRGLWYEQDRANAARLHDSEKDRAENVMIVDMVRNDMGRIAEVGSVEVTSLFDVEQYPTLWQMTSSVRCDTNAGIADIFGALFPPASITGAPKARTMEIIAELEDSPRRIYCGTAGVITGPRSAQFNVAIRTVLIDKRTGDAEYGAGGGIVWDSTSESEFEECATKTRVLSHVPPEFSLLETVRWTPSTPAGAAGEGFFLLDRHMRRLGQSAEYFAFDVDIEAIERLLSASVADLAARPYRVRLIVPREGSPVVDVQPLVQRPASHVCLAKQPIVANDPFLYHKTTRRETYERARQACPGYDDVLLWNEKGEITESCIANIVIEMDGERFTPSIECGLLPGVYRSLLLEQGRVKERTIRIEDLARCTRITLVNSVREQWEASSGGGFELPAFAL